MKNEILAAWAAAYAAALAANNDLLATLAFSRYLAIARGAK